MSSVKKTDSPFHPKCHHSSVDLCLFSSDLHGGIGTASLVNIRVQKDRALRIRLKKLRFVSSRSSTSTPGTISAGHVPSSKQPSSVHKQLINVPHV